MHATKEQKPVGYILSQLAVTLLVSALLLVLGKVPAASALAGGLIATVANAWFALKVFTAKRMDDPAVFLRTFYWGELNKVILTAALFIVAFVYIRPLNAAALLATYFIVHMTPFLHAMVSDRLDKTE